MRRSQSLPDVTIVPVSRSTSFAPPVTSTTSVSGAEKAACAADCVANSSVTWPAVVCVGSSMPITRTFAKPVPDAVRTAYTLCGSADTMCVWKSYEYQSSPNAVESDSVIQSSPEAGTDAAVTASKSPSSVAAVIAITCSFVADSF